MRWIGIMEMKDTGKKTKDWWVSEIEKESFIFCKINIFGLAVYVKKLLRGGINYEKNVYRTNNRN